MLQLRQALDGSDVAGLGLWSGALLLVRRAAAEPEALESRQHLDGEIRQLLQVVHEVDGQAVEPRRSQPREFLRDRIGIAHDAVRPAREGAAGGGIAATVYLALRIVLAASLLRVQIGQIPNCSPVGV